MADVIHLHEQPPTIEETLDLVREQNPKTVLVVGTRADGQTFFASNETDFGHLMMWLKIAEAALIEAVTND